MSTNKFLPALSGVLVLVIFILDSLMPPDLTLGSLYAVVVLLLLQRRPRTIIIAATVGVVLTLAAPYLVQSQGLQLSDYYTRGLAVLTIIAIAIVVSRLGLYKKSQQESSSQLASDQMLQDNNHQLERYTHVVTHNLSEPIEVISDTLKELKGVAPGKEEDPAGKRGFRLIEAAALRLKRMITALRGLSGLGNNSTMESVDTHAMLESIKLNLAPRLESLDAQLIIADNLPVVTGMKDELRQVFQEAIDNALKFRHPSTPPVIEVDCNDELMEWKFSVADNGLGVPQAAQEEVFRMFTQLNPKEDYPGQGLGLALSAKIIDLHLGRIWIEPRDGKGSRLCFTIMKSPV